MGFYFGIWGLVAFASFAPLAFFSHTSVLLYFQKKHKYRNNLPLKRGTFVL